MTASGPAAAALRRFREHADLSVGDLAALLGMSKSSYQHYESKYKKDYLPPHWYPMLAAIGRRHKATEEDIRELYQTLPADLREDMLRSALSSVIHQGSEREPRSLDR